MLNSFRWLLVAMALAATIAFGACGDSGNNDNSDKKTDEQPVATDDTSSDGSSDNGNPSSGDGSSSGDFQDVAVPSGADEQSSGTFSSSQIPFVVPDPDFKADAYGSIEWKLYELDTAPGDVIDFYKDELGDWKEVFVASIDEGGYGVWTRDDGRQAVWVGASSSNGKTQMTLIVGKAED